MAVAREIEDLLGWLDGDGSLLDNDETGNVPFVSSVLFFLPLTK